MIELSTVLGVQLVWLIGCPADGIPQQASVLGQSVSTNIWKEPINLFHIPSAFQWRNVFGSTSGGCELNSLNVKLLLVDILKKILYVLNNNASHAFIVL